MLDLIRCADSINNNGFALLASVVLAGWIPGPVLSTLKALIRPLYKDTFHTHTDKLGTLPGLAGFSVPLIEAGRGLSDSPPCWKRDAKRPLVMLFPGYGAGPSLVWNIAPLRRSEEVNQLLMPLQGEVCEADRWVQVWAGITLGIWTEPLLV